MVAAKAKKMAIPSGGVDPRNMWYASDRRIRTATAAQEAIEVAELAAGSARSETRADEQVLFQALHVCAFQANRPVKGSKAAAGRQAWCERWEAIRGYIVEQNLGLVYSMIGRFGSRQLDEDDMLSEAMYALTRAVDRFNPWRGFKFSTYACNVIARAIMRRGKQESNYRRLFPVQHDVLFERSTGTSDVGMELYVERLQGVMERNLGELTELETTILTRRFPEERESRLTFQEIGDEVGLSKERVRQIQNVALNKLRVVLDADPVLQ
jgi:RNA polymerase primary sigma factor